MIPNLFSLRRLAVAVCAALVTTELSQAAIESNFDDQVYPGAAGAGWVAGWQNTAITPPPQVLTANPIDSGSPYLHFDATGSTSRNLLRQYQSGEGVSVSTPHYIRWKFRLTEIDFDTQFTAFNDRLHFFARTAARPTGSTDANISWSIMAAGAAHTSGAVGGKTFWVFDNVDGTGNFTLENHVDTLIPAVPNHIYRFEVLVRPDQRTYSVSIVDETTSASFTSADPLRFRNLGVPGESHTFLHFGGQTTAATELRPFDLDSVSLTPWGGPGFTGVTPAPYAIHDAAKGVTFNVVGIDPIPMANIGLTLNGADVSAQLNITGTETDRAVTYSGLTANQVYQMTITATNASGTASLTSTFYTATTPFTLYNSEGFSSDTFYPVGPLGPVTHGTGTWVPAVEPAEVIDLADGTYGKVLQRMNMGAARTDFLQFPPVSSGVITIEFDASASTTLGRTIDMALMPSTGEWASHVAWGAISEKISYYNTSAGDWIPITDLPTGWHHCKVIHYLSGPAAGRFDFLVNNTPVGEKLLWRNVVPGTPLTRLSYQSHNTGPVLEYGRIDNLVLTAAPEDPNAFPPPVITNVSPVSYAVVRPAASISFDVTSVLPISAANLSVLLNGSNISSGLNVTGTPNNLSVTYGPVGEGRHTVEIAATNNAGAIVTTVQFYATADSLTLFDSGGFSNDLLYPVGPLTAVTNADWYWAPSVEPSEIVDLADGTHGKVLRRMQMGIDRTDYLHFAPVSSGIVKVEFDARSSNMEGRTLDMSLNSMSTGSGTQGPFIMWGTNMLNHYNGTAWVPVAPLNTAWHHFEIISYVSGPKAGTFDLKVDDNLVDQGLVWRFLYTVAGTLRIGAIRGSLIEYGELDNLVIKAAPEPILARPVSLSNPARTATTFSFSFQSLNGVNYLAQHIDNLGSTTWTTLETIPGDGTLKTVTHTNPPAGPLFYRVQSALP